jgi:hypothetical protein
MLSSKHGNETHRQIVGVVDTATAVGSVRATDAGVVSGSGKVLIHDVTSGLVAPFQGTQDKQKPKCSCASNCNCACECSKCGCECNCGCKAKCQCGADNCSGPTKKRQAAVREMNRANMSVLSHNTLHNFKAGKTGESTHGNNFMATEKSARDKPKQEHAEKMQQFLAVLKKRKRPKKIDKEEPENGMDVE